MKGKLCTCMQHLETNVILNCEITPFGIIYTWYIRSYFYLSKF